MHGSRGFCLASEMISHTIRPYHRFCLRFQKVEALLTDRGSTVSEETIRSECGKFGLASPHTLYKRSGRLGDTGHIDQLGITIQGLRQDLWRTVIQERDTLDIFVQRGRK
jgi:putative transposase